MSFRLVSFIFIYVCLTCRTNHEKFFAIMLKIFISFLLFSFSIFATEYFDTNPCGTTFWKQEDAVKKLESVAPDHVQNLRTKLYSRTRVCTTDDGCTAWRGPIDLAFASGDFGHAGVGVHVDPHHHAVVGIAGDIWAWLEWYPIPPGDPGRCYLGANPYKPLIPSDPDFVPEMAWEDYRYLGKVGESSYSFEAVCGVGAQPLQFTGYITDGCNIFRSSTVSIGSATRRYETQWAIVSLPDPY
jgi:hypothetical protein